MRTPTLSHPVQWLKRGGFAVLDQAVFAGTSFVATVLLARWLSADQLGAFAIGYSILLFAGGVHGALLVEPMAVFGAGKHAASFDAYLRMLLRAHWLVALLLAAVAAAPAWALDAWSPGHPLVPVLAALAAALPFVLLLWLLRRAFYVRLAPERAALCGTIYLIVAIGTLVGLERWKALSAATALLALAFASLVASVAKILLLRMSPADTGAAPSRDDVRADHVRYGQWAVAAAVIVWLSNNVQNFIVAAVSDLAAVGALRALDTLLLPFWHVQAALSAVLLPAFGAAAYVNRASLAQRVKVTAASFLMLAMAMWLFLALFGETLMHRLYQHRYDDYAYLMKWYGLILMPDCVAAVLLLGHRAVSNTRIVFAYHAAMLVALVLVALPAVVLAGFPAIVFARVGISYALLAAFLALSRKELGAGHHAHRMPAR